MRSVSEMPITASSSAGSATPSPMMMSTRRLKRETVMGPESLARERAATPIERAGPCDGAGPLGLRWRSNERRSALRVVVRQSGQRVQLGHDLGIRRRDERQASALDVHDLARDLAAGHGAA